jgi:hypothetical protein
MRPTLEQLHDENNYIETESFHIDDMMQFVNRELGFGTSKKESSKFKSSLVLIASMIFGGILGFGLIRFGGSTQMLIGFGVLMLVVLPIHEWIHGLTFKSFGAPDVGYGFSHKAGMIYAYAQNFPITMPELRKVAMMPFVVITPILIILLLLLPSYKAVILTILIIHTLSCMGDYSLIKYANRNMNKEVYTYDDIRDKKMSYFFEKK